MQLHEPGDVVARPRLVAVELPDPEPGPGEVLVEVAACAVCRTDLQIVEGDLPPHRLPLIPGHQVVGRVAGCGPGADPDLLGRRVGVAWIAGTCGTCRFCRSGRENLCEQFRFTGWDRDGGFATACSARADAVHPLPDGFGDLAAAPLLCGGVIGYRSLRVCGVRPGERVGLFGFGASATCVIQIARHWGCEVYVATRSTDEQDRARALGAVWAGGYDDAVPEPLDRAITFAPAGSVVVHALRSLDRGGTVAVNAIHLDHVPELDYGDLWWERTLRSVANVTRADAREFLALAAEIPITTATRRYPLDRANDALLDLKLGKVPGAAVLDTQEVVP